MELNERNTVEQQAGASKQGADGEQRGTGHPETAAKAGSSILRAIARELRMIAEGVVNSFKAGGEARALMTWTLLSALFLFIMISFAAWPALAAGLYYAFGLPTYVLPDFTGTVIAVAVLCVLHARSLLFLLGLWAKDKYDESCDAARYASTQPQGDGAFDAYFAEAMVDAFVNGGPSSTDCAYSGAASTYNDGFSGSSVSDKSWEEEQRRQNEYFHRNQAEQAEYGGYSWDANYHRNMQRQYRS